MSILPSCRHGGVHSEPLPIEEGAVQDGGVDEVGEAVLIEETLTNMLFNTVKYTPDGGKIWMEVKQHGTSIEISIADTGIGVPEVDLPHILEEFYRADNARAIERGGTGLGLAFAKRVVEQHGGRSAGRDGTGGFARDRPRSSDRWWYG